jgi:hypothetical protein
MAPQQSHLLQASSAMLWPASQATLAEKVQIMDWYYSNGKNSCSLSLFQLSKIVPINSLSMASKGTIISHYASCGHSFIHEKAEACEESQV